MEYRIEHDSMGEVQVPADRFVPAPKVNSAVIRIKLWDEKPYVPKSEDLFFRTVKAAFGQRRKTLMNCLFNLGNLGFSKEELTEIIQSLGWDERIRGEALGLEEFAALTDRIAERKANK